ncbi:MAG TPA: sulfite exporter TauE/SafE family protein, partial [Nitrososphaera sp.]
MPIDLLTIIILGLLGLAIGFVGGLLGLVLGVLRFPIILAAAGGSGATAATVAGTNIGISTLGAMTAAIRHFRKNNVHLRIFAVMAATGAAGAFLGSTMTQQVPATLLFIIVGLIVSYEAYSLITSTKRNKTEQNVTRKPNLGIESSIGFSVGFLGGMVGLVLGSIRMPAMIEVLKMEPKVAIGTNLAAS